VKARPQQWKACSTPGCPELVNAQNPCAKHGRPLNAHWSSDRDRGKQRDFRAKVLERDGHACTRCPSTGPLVAHHIRPGYDVSAGITLCEDCHSAVDSHAR
jgi:5-methylcytosine-specific restriction endonuclease McrA